MAREGKCIAELGAFFALTVMLSSVVMAKQTIIEGKRVGNHADWRISQDATLVTRRYETTRGLDHVDVEGISLPAGYMKALGAVHAGIQTVITDVLNNRTDAPFFSRASSGDYGDYRLWDRRDDALIGQLYKLRLSNNKIRFINREYSHEIVERSAGGLVLWAIESDYGFEPTRTSLLEHTDKSIPPEDRGLLLIRPMYYKTTWNIRQRVKFANEAMRLLYERFVGQK